MVKDTSDPAFPVTATEYGGNAPFFGMSLRDYFAAAALQGLLAAPGGDERRAEFVVEQAYDTADAMLAERAKE